MCLMCCRPAGVRVEQQLSGLCGEAALLQHVRPAACGAAVSGSAGGQLPLETLQICRAPAGSPGPRRVSVQSHEGHVERSRPAGQPQTPAVPVRPAAARTHLHHHGPDLAGRGLAQTGTQLRFGVGAASPQRRATGSSPVSPRELAPTGTSPHPASDPGLTGRRVPQPPPVSLQAAEKRHPPPSDPQQRVQGPTPLHRLQGRGLAGLDHRSAGLHGQLLPRRVSVPAQREPERHQPRHPADAGALAGPAGHASALLRPHPPLAHLHALLRQQRQRGAAALPGHGGGRVWVSMNGTHTSDWLVKLKRSFVIFLCRFLMLNSLCSISLMIWQILFSVYHVTASLVLKSVRFNMFVLREGLNDLKKIYRVNKISTYKFIINLGGTFLLINTNGANIVVSKRLIKIKLPGLSRRLLQVLLLLDTKIPSCKR